MSKELATQLKKLASIEIGREEVRLKFIERLQNELLTRDERQLTHVAVFVMAIDISKSMVYIGHHKKSDRWIPHGGHVDKGELIEQTLEREIQEEWGIQMKANDIGEPEFLTITEIENPKQWKVCRRHYDVWYFVRVNNEDFEVDPELLHEEFHEARWVNLNDARNLVGNTPTVQEALDFVEMRYFQKD
ncbi:MAG: hypothetical protein UT24_C0008G0079 [Candidatus Woesebacteria bacterium GW2011_GWB1_39_12]|uniref:Nudix hydrolase domain-containing protein n=2 Tax=Candidatus Woeseibacteriota TaxID=1752722 RepID=A0A0G0MAN5_9BACT|nr:MAG: hypothetical protein UT23_C0012G0020 [Candidatus Woesebacteria bacterium GW2011_GWA1_39_12]KKR00951.1 MAG: hypothetical protein UT24_C0008G0079 [Candidatus Woesebacteria bacterium GW2011_GWB1_39_12]